MCPLCLKQKKLIDILSKSDLFTPIQMPLSQTPDVSHVLKSPVVSTHSLHNTVWLHTQWAAGNFSAVHTQKIHTH